MPSSGGREVDSKIGSMEKRWLGPRSGRVFVANRCHSAKLHHAPEHVGSNVGTARLVAQIFRELLFAAVRSHEARLDGHLRNAAPPTEYPYYLMVRGFLRK
jgi:hypothetical protein